MGDSNALSVSAALSVAKGQLEAIALKVVGEVSEVSVNARYRAVYFTVKDESASMPCMMWNNRYHASGVELRVGMLVELTGRFTLYAAKGRMNFDVFGISVAGEGDLRLRVANLAKRLQAEGLMEPSRKRAIPSLPLCIGLVTSPRGAAVYDVLRTLRRRYPLARVVFAGVGVEGSGAPAGIIEGMHAVSDAGAEVILLVRGGGSFEDLMPFNDEGLARAIAQSPVPVVTGIGHEPDNSIADMVADVRASTPTAAAERVAPTMRELSSAIDAVMARIGGSLSARLASSSARLERLASSPIFREPERLFEGDAQHLDDLSDRLAIALPGSLARNQTQLTLMRQTLKLRLGSLMPRFFNEVKGGTVRLLSSGELLLRPFQEKCAIGAARLDAYSPLSALARGYSIAQGADGSVIKSIAEVSEGDALTVRVSDGAIDCAVRGKTQMTYALEEVNG